MRDERSEKLKYHKQYYQDNKEYFWRTRSRTGAVGIRC